MKKQSVICVRVRAPPDVRVPATSSGHSVCGGAGSQVDGSRILL